MHIFCFSLMEVPDSMFLKMNVSGTATTDTVLANGIKGNALRRYVSTGRNIRLDFTSDSTTEKVGLIVDAIAATDYCRH